MPIDAPSSDNGKIRDSNKIMLMSALQDLNIQYVVDGGTAKDEYVLIFLLQILKNEIILFK
jgi:molybdopterin biosynthesis enzyme